MPSSKQNTRNWFAKKIAIIFMIVGFTQYVFAVDGTLNGGGSKKNSFSTIKKDLNLSLRSGFNISNKSFGYKKSNKTMMFNSMMSFQKGNVTYFIPYKNKTILQKFKTPSAPSIR
jgi:hypothetical protein